jgi:hypothetical protein
MTEVVRQENIREKKPISKRPQKKNAMDAWCYSLLFSTLLF